VAESVVDVLEGIEIEVDHSWVRARAGSATQRVRDTVTEQRPVRQTRQRVVEGLMHELVLGALAVGDVVQVDHDALDVGLVEQVDGAARQPHFAAVGPRGACLARQHHTGSEEGLVEQRPRVDVGVRQEVERTMASGLLAWIPEQRGEVRRVVHDAAVGIQDEHRVGRVGGEGAVQPLAREQSRLGSVTELEESHRPGTGEHHERERGPEQRQGVGVGALVVGHQLDEAGDEKGSDRQRDAGRSGLCLVLIGFGLDVLGFRDAPAPCGEQGRTRHPSDVEEDTDRTVRGGDQEREVRDQPQPDAGR
jgi:hypothetical protein